VYCRGLYLSRGGEKLFLLKTLMRLYSKKHIFRLFSDFNPLKKFTLRVSKYNLWRWFSRNDFSRKNFNFIKFNQNCRNLNEILHISGNIESTKKADHILEMPRLGVFWWKLTVYDLRINAANYFKDLRRPTIRPATVMFCWDKHCKCTLIDN